MQEQHTGSTGSTGSTASQDGPQHEKPLSQPADAPHGTTIRVGVAGYGSASKTFHVPLILSTPGLVLQAVSSSCPGKVKQDLPDLPIERTAEALMARDDIDLIVLPTPNATHFELAEAALRHGKHVVVDKPFTLNLDDARRLAKLAEDGRRLLTVFHNRRWDADFLAVRDLIEQETLGRISSFESTFHYYRPEPRDRWRERAGEGGGTWNDIGPHLVDQVLQLFGLPEAVYLDAAALRDRSQTDDYFIAQLRYPDKRVTLRVNAGAGLPVPRFIIQGSRASYAKFGTDVQEAALQAGQRPNDPSRTGKPWGHDPIVGALTVHANQKTEHLHAPPGNYPAFYASVRDALRIAGPDPERAPVAAVDVHSALNVMAVLDLGRESLAARAERPMTDAYLRHRH